MEARRFSPSWTVEDHLACFIIKDSNRQALAHVYYEEGPGRQAGMARRVIERQLQAQGIRRTRYAEVMAQARAYLAEHQGLFDQATERVQRNPTLRAMAERESVDANASGASRAWWNALFPRQVAPKRALKTLENLQLKGDFRVC
jgi:hypothetical protein